MSTDLTRIGEKARRERSLVFTSLYHNITDIGNLRACYETLPGNRAVGVDGVTKEMYGKALEANLQNLSCRLKNLGYRPQPKRRTYIPKAGSKKGRPLGISCFEDKIVELAVKRVLESIYETDFLDSSYGYRPGRSQHDCLDDLGRTLQQGRVSRIAEADIRSFFDEVNHKWLLKFLGHRIGDQRVIRLIDRMLRGGIMEDGLVQAGERGTPQGSILSPLLSNVYLHYVLDLWFERKFKKHCRGRAFYFRYADDYLACFELHTDAADFLKWMPDRLEGFGLEVAPEKTGSLAFGRFARTDAQAQGKKPKEFTFLGFTHYCGKTREGHYKVKRRTSRKKLGQSLRELGSWAQRVRHLISKGEMLRQARVRIIGHMNYYSITDNSKQCSRYRYFANRLLFKWLNRKSQRSAYTWDGFNEALKHMNWPSTKVRKNLNPFRRVEVR